MPGNDIRLPGIRDWRNRQAGAWDTSPKQGSSIVRFLPVEAAQVTVRSLPEWRSKYFHLVVRRGRKIAKVAWPAAWLCNCSL